ncbi:serine/threonine-protein phosphatase 2A activator-like [Linepithema humile]|uniref:serine/threonine-protein phosphatase 2A activator-like n=1 Tax=Linepithema humile TaxID=83485 RepID=UPI0006239F34|nr:PREDICTED: serine/threonine-protein phosphatase 2A activator-like [Linepithema humile]XP_012233288.1 PREDICTED: serine/threonine-protein phosphatase 2A activator-like [Linepithema humile]XP_012233289.1 PREDICTED: serine/threonine-protein phosphatase 2A activator-like [Linepithema humile]
MSTPKFPIKETQLLPDQHEFIVPKKCIKVPTDITVWQKSEAYFEYLGFILALNEAVQGKTLDTECVQSPILTNVIQMLNKFDEWITEIPPTEQPQRFGNKSFRTWHEKLQQNAAEELKRVLPEKLHRAIPEIVQYLDESFGNPTRIDYGTGHEMAFLMFLCCMFKIGAFKEDDKVAVAIKVFNRYLELVRRLQLTYRMEPAGSHGVWSLDDYQFIPFIWGSAQLIGHPRIEPRHFVDQGVVESYSKKYMFLGCIEFISKVKIGPFAEHSNQLWNVSAVSTWSKVNSGLIKMYKAEVLAKFPVIQHVFFGSLLPLIPMNNPSTNPKTRLNESAAASQ